MMRLLFLLAFLCCLPLLSVQAQDTAVVVNTAGQEKLYGFIKLFYKPGQVIRGYTLIPAGDGNVYWSGLRGDSAFIAKVTPSGNVLKLYVFEITASQPDNITDLRLDSEGMLVGCGRSGDFLYETQSFIFRFDPLNGKVLWIQQWKNTSYVNGLVDLPGKNAYVLYENPHDANGDNARLLFFDRTTGQLNSQNTTEFNLGGSDSYVAMEEYQGNIYGVGRFTDGGGYSQMRHALAKLKPDGKPDWIKLSPISTDSSARLYGRDVIVDQDAVVSVFCGDNQGVDLFNSSVFLQKNDLDGKLLWVREYEILDLVGEFVEEIVAVPDGYVLFGQSLYGEQELFLIKTDKEGKLLWSYRLAMEGGQTLGLQFSKQDQLIAVDSFIYGTGVSYQFGLDAALLFRFPITGQFELSCGDINPINIKSTLLSSATQTDFTKEVKITSPVLNATAQPNPLAKLGTFKELTLCQIPDPYGCDTLPDLVVRIDSTVCNKGLGRIYLTICNQGSRAVNGETTVGFYTRNPTLLNSTYLASFKINLDLKVDACTDTFFNLNEIYLNGHSGVSSLVAAVNINPDLTTPIQLADNIESLTECSYYNNFASANVQLKAFLPLELGPNRNFCSDTTVLLTSNKNYYFYNWSNGNTDKQILAKAPGFYQLTVTDECGLEQTDSIRFSVRPQPENLPDLQVCAGKSITVEAPEFEAYSWKVAAPFNCKSFPCQKITITPDSTVNAFLTAWDDYSCIWRDTFQIEYVNKPVVTYNIVFPEGETVLIQGQAYSQPGVYTISLPGQGTECDTLATYILKYAPPEPCDLKTVGPMRFELLEICRQPGGEYTYKFKVTNQGPDPVEYVLFQVPDGIQAIKPVNSSVFQGEDERSYTIRNPHYTPFYSVRFKTKVAGTGLKKGESDVFEYTLPEQSNPLFVHTMVKLENDKYWEAHLNAFNCEVKDCFPKTVQKKPAIVSESITTPVQHELAGAKNNSEKGFLIRLGNINENERGSVLCPIPDNQSFYGAGTSGDKLLLYKATEYGEILWQDLIDISPAYDELSELILDSEGMLVGSGTSGDSVPDTHGFVFRYNPEKHQTLWSTIFYDASNLSGGLVELKPGGNYLYYDNHFNPNINDDARLMEITRATGKPVAGSNRLYDLGLSDAFFSALIHQDTLYATGRFTAGNTYANMRHGLTKIDPKTRKPVWSNITPITSTDTARLYGKDLIIDSYQQIVSVSSGNITATDLDRTYVLVQKNTLDGKTLWVKRYDLPEWQTPFAQEIVEVQDGYVILGEGFHKPYQLFLLKIDFNGNIVWAKKIKVDAQTRLELGNTLQTEMFAFNNSLFFTASTVSAAGRTDILLGRLSADDGLVNSSCGMISSTPAKMLDFPNVVTTNFNFKLLDTVHTTIKPLLAEGQSAALAVTPVCAQKYNVPLSQGACDTKTTTCIIFELLDICRTSQGDRQYTYKVTNRCAADVSWVAFQLPQGVIADAPVNGSYVDGLENNVYLVRNPNASPFYSIRFRLTNGQLNNSGFDYFQLTLPEQSEPLFILGAARLETGEYYEAHLNTFNCDVKTCPKTIEERSEKTEQNFDIYPNPSTGNLTFDLTDQSETEVEALILDGRGAQVDRLSFQGGAIYEWSFDKKLTSGIYVVRLLVDGREVKSTLIMLTR